MKPLQFELTIVQRKPNPDYDPTRTFGVAQPPYLEERMVYVVLKPSEFDAVRKALIEAIEMAEEQPR